MRKIIIKLGMRWLLMIFALMVILSPQLSFGFGATGLPESESPYQVPESQTAPAPTKFKAESKIFGGSYETIGEFIGAKVVPFSIALAVMGAILMITIAGNTYVGSGGSPEATGEAKEMIIGALLGLTTIVLAGLFVKNFLV